MVRAGARQPPRTTIALQLVAAAGRGRDRTRQPARVALFGHMPIFSQDCRGSGRRRVGGRGLLEHLLIREEGHDEPVRQRDDHAREEDVPERRQLPVIAMDDEHDDGHDWPERGRHEEHHK
eukprot:scaffold5174_cov118-Isochrysis_galbana.AAC.2